MAGYTKLFESILDSTVWGESNETRLVWITMLAMRNKNHMVEAAVPGLARRARVSIEDTEKALKKFSSPDPYSRTKDFEGRRIREVDGGWLILNGENYRNRLNMDERREYQRIKQAEYRAKKKDGNGVPLSASEIINKRVREDPITKADRAAMRKKGVVMASPTVSEEYDLGDTEDVKAGVP